MWHCLILERGTIQNGGVGGLAAAENIEDPVAVCRFGKGWQTAGSPNRQTVGYSACISVKYFVSA